MKVQLSLSVLCAGTIKPFLMACLLFAQGAYADDALTNALAGEFALQRGDMSGAAKRYADAAVRGRDARLLERAATIALFARDYRSARAIGEHWLNIDRSAIGAHRTLAWTAAAQADASLAFTHLDRLFALASVESQRAAAQVLIAAENRASAGGLLERLDADRRLQRLPQGPNWSSLASHLGLHRLAADLAEADVAAAPKDPESFRRLAQARLAAGDRPGALQALKRALALKPKDFELRLAMAVIYAEDKRYLDADKILAAGGDATERGFAARIANAAREPDAKLLRRIEKALNRAEPGELPTRAFLLGQVAELDERWDDALSWYAQETSAAAVNDASLRRAVITAREKNDLLASRALLAAMRERSDDAQARIDAWLLESELVAEHEPSAASTVYDAALAAHPRDFRLLYARALYRVGIDDLVGLESDLRTILDIDPDNPQALNALGYTLTDKTERHDEALGYIKRALEIDPDEAAFIDSMGWVQYRLGNLSEALRYLKRAYSLIQDGEVAAHLAEVLWVSGERDEAEKLWREALGRWPENEVLLDSIHRLHPELKR